MGGAQQLEDWSAWLRAGGASEKTITTRVSGIAAACSYLKHDDPVSFTSRQLVRWLAHCRSPWTRRTYWSTARQWHAWLVAEGLRLDNPTERLPRPPQPRGIPRPASSASLGAVLETAPRRVRAYILLATFAGLRVHEIAKVRGEDFEAGGLYVLGKGGQQHWVPVHPLIEQVRRGFPAEGYWFASDTDLGHVKPESVSNTISRAFRRHGFEVTAHQLRHWFGTHALRSSRDLRVTQELMRHMSISSTQVYTEVASRAKVETVRRLAV